MLKEQYANTNGLVKGIKAALKRQGLTVSKMYKGRITWKSTEGLKVENQYDEVYIQFNFHQYNNHIPSQQTVIDALVAEGIASEDISIYEKWHQEFIVVKAEQYVAKYI